MTDQQYVELKSELRTTNELLHELMDGNGTPGHRTVVNDLYGDRQKDPDDRGFAGDMKTVKSDMRIIKLAVLLGVAIFTGESVGLLGWLRLFLPW